MACTEINNTICFYFLKFYFPSDLANVYFSCAPVWLVDFFVYLTCVEIFQQKKTLLHVFAFTAGGTDKTSYVLNVLDERNLVAKEAMEHGAFAIFSAEDHLFKFKDRYQTIKCRL